MLAHSTNHNPSAEGKTELWTPTIKYRVVKWRANDHDYENVRVFWEGADLDDLYFMLSHLNLDLVPHWCPDLGVITEFQKLSEGDWYPCQDPRQKAECPPPAVRILIVDDDRKLWDKFRNLFAALGVQIIMADNIHDAQRFIFSSKESFDAVIVNDIVHGNSTEVLVRQLKVKNFAGPIYGFANEATPQIRLKTVGCDEIFVKTHRAEDVGKDMLTFFRKLGLLKKS